MLERCREPHRRPGIHARAGGGARNRLSVAPSPPMPPLSRRTALALGLAAALLYMALAGVRIEAQGPQYDELHQATGAFTWLGEPPPPFFCMSAFGRVCVLSMPYSAALKTNLYGAYLRLFQPRFTLASWRWLGIVLIASGLVLFSVLARRALSLPGLAVFLALFVTDVTVLLDGRFDWGPVAISLLLRLVLLGAWMGSEAGEGGPSARSSFVLGALSGFAVFEKLSAVVLVPLVAVLVLGSPGRRSVRHLAAAGAGVAAGVLPLALVNLGSLISRGTLVSPVGGGPGVDRSLSGLLAYTGEYLTLGQGGIFRAFMLGIGRWPWAEILEGALAGAAFLFIAVLAARREAPLPLQLAGISLAGYGAVWIGLWLLPRATWAHHWILGTPIQYAALALALSAPMEKRFWGAVLAALWIAARLPGLIAVEQALARGSASPAWDPSLARLGKFAAARADEAVFIASDWGVATQIHTFGNGRPGLVHEPFWRYRGAETLRDIPRTGNRRVLYLVRLRNPPRVVPGTTDRIERDLAADPGLREVPAEPEAAALREVLVRKYIVLPEG